MLVFDITYTIDVCLVTGDFNNEVRMISIEHRLLRKQGPVKQLVTRNSFLFEGTFSPIKPFVTAVTDNSKYRVIMVVLIDPYKNPNIKKWWQHMLSKVAVMVSPKILRKRIETIFLFCPAFLSMNFLDKQLRPNQQCESKSLFDISVCVRKLIKMLSELRYPDMQPEDRFVANGKLINTLKKLTIENSILQFQCFLKRTIYRQFPEDEILYKIFRQNV
ncbi:hypothetical protein EDC96DRAFT_563519 [Choanephora cucurbitarum]|nr:hypothetical protein EDC96DRAFT_563519 [Choanephora cucurbitarum]